MIELELIEDSEELKEMYENYDENILKLSLEMRMTPEELEEKFELLRLLKMFHLLLEKETLNARLIAQMFGGSTEEEE